MIKFFLKLVLLALGIIVLLSINYIFYFVLGFVALSVIVTGATYVYSLFSENDYSFICDQNNLLYRTNSIGKIALIIMVCVGIGYLIAPTFVTTLINMWI
jgi:hypothetical protein